MKDLQILLKQNTATTTRLSKDTIQTLFWQNLSIAIRVAYSSLCITRWEYASQQITFF